MKCSTNRGLENMTTKKYLKPEEVAEELGISVQSLAQDRYRGEGIPYVKIGSRVRYLASDLEDFIEANRVDPSAPVAMPANRPARVHSLTRR